MNEGDADSLALSVPCPVCNAPSDSTCIYVWPKGVKECEFPNPNTDECAIHSDTQHERLAKVGMPTKIVHNARKRVVFNRSARKRQLRELERLADWLRRYGDIFMERGDG